MACRLLNQCWPSSPTHIGGSRGDEFTASGRAKFQMDDDDDDDDDD